MKRYTIYCTQEQTKKALELGAPLETRTNKNPFVNVGFLNSRGQFVSDSYDIPTAEQMLGWLGTQGLSIDVEWSWDGQSTMWVWDNTKKEHVYTSCDNSHKETTLAAIDAALEQLMKVKEEKKWKKN